MIETLQIGLALVIGGIGLSLVAHLRYVRAAAARTVDLQDGGVR